MESTDLILYKSYAVSDVGTNGGRISTTSVTSNVLNNMFPNISETERTSGTTRYRKFFFKNNNASAETAANSRFWISSRSTGGDYFRIKAGTNTDTQSDASSYTSWLGSGYLSAQVTPDSTAIEAVFDVADGIYNGSRIRLTDSSGVEEFLVVNTVSWLSTTATITPTTSPLNTYAAAATSLVCGVVDVSSLICSTASWVETSVSGTYDETTYPVEVNNVGTVEDTWTLTFTSAIAFTVSGAITGSVGSGTRGSNFSPINPNASGNYYFMLRATGWGGTWAIGDTVTFATHHSAASIWVKEIVPASTSALSPNTFKFKLYAEGS